MSQDLVTELRLAVLRLLTVLSDKEWRSTRDQEAIREVRRLLKLTGSSELQRLDPDP